MREPLRIRLLDSHTGGEPTRLVLDGAPPLVGDTLLSKREHLRREHDWLRSSLVTEPRGSEVMVGALLLEPGEPGRLCDVIFFNNVGYIGMCGHGTIGLVASLAWLGRAPVGTHRIGTVVGEVTAELHADGRVTVENVASWRHREDVALAVDGYGEVTGDVAWGGNWFYLVTRHAQRVDVDAIDALDAFTVAVKRALVREGVTGAEGGEIDHIEVFGPPSDPSLDSRNFVLCPGGAYDRSPCGTGTSAKLACLAADGRLAPGDVWRQESITGSVFDATYRAGDAPGRVLPSITGRAWMSAETTAVLDPSDPFVAGIGASTSPFDEGART